jgi:hypothetical protein
MNNYFNIKILFITRSTDCKIKLWQLPEKNEKTQVVDTIEEHKETVTKLFISNE